jgi:glutathione synthetase
MIQLTTRSSPIEISVVYYRAGYTPDDYSSEVDYETRFKLEGSNAIQCPSIPLQLAGGKKVQQVLTNPGVLEGFIQDSFNDGEAFEDSTLEEIKETWMNMWGLDEADGVKRALEQYAHLVLKPQREGGGNNVYTSHIPEFLKVLPEKEREAWIAMEMIQPPQGVKNWMVKAGDAKTTESEVVSEIGIFGWAFFGEGRPTIEKEAGWLVRTKGRESDEGGVAVGFSVLDSIIHLDDQ